jgi:hypothetical protein
MILKPKIISQLPITNITFLQENSFKINTHYILWLIA